MQSRESLYRFMEGNFDYLLAVDGDGRIVHASNLFRNDFFTNGEMPADATLENLLTDESLDTFKAAMAQARDGGRGIAMYAPRDGSAMSLPLKAGHAAIEDGEMFLFFGNVLAGLRKQDEWEKDERIKELACIYNVAELIEVTKSVGEFFTKLPQCISNGMLHPEEAVVYSNYQGIEYGQEPLSAKSLSVDLVVGKHKKGIIKVGYLDELHELLPEEQKMLDEIGRILNLALERKELKEHLELMRVEEGDYDRRIEELKEDISSRTKELEEQKQKLGVINSYLDRMKGGWEEARTRLETMFKAIPDEVVLIDKKRKVVMTNREDVKPGTYCFKVFFGRDKPCEDCRLARILQDKTPVTLTMKRDDKYLQVHALPVYNHEHEVDGILEFYRDITLEKTYEQQLQQADKLASLGQLVSGIGHEINNPNQFIRGNIKIIQQSLDDMLPIVDDYHREHPDLKIARLNYEFFREHIMTLVDDMAHGSERIKGIVEGLRSFVRKDEGLLLDTVDINTMLEATTRLVHNEVHKRADIELDLAENLPVFNGNSQKVEQVLVNLIVNAGDAIKDGQKGLIVVRTRTEDGDIVVEIEDNGIGMNQSTLKQIFDPFFTTKRARGGTGLGLAIAYRIIEEHGGNIQVTSKPGVGTKFAIKIPGRSEDGNNAGKEK